MIDKVSSVDLAYDISRAALLPLDMEREKGCSYDALMKSIFQSSAKVKNLPSLILIYFDILLIFSLLIMATF